MARRSEAKDGLHDDISVLEEKVNAMSEFSNM
jgi:hypothetical protein